MATTYQGKLVYARVDIKMIVAVKEDRLMTDVMMNDYSKR